MSTFTVELNPSKATLGDVLNTVKTLEAVAGIENPWRIIDPVLYEALDAQADYYRSLGLNRYDFEWEIVNVIHANKLHVLHSDPFHSVKAIDASVVREIIRYIGGVDA